MNQTIGVAWTHCLTGVSDFISYFFSFPFYNRHISWICFCVRDMYDFYMGVQIFYFVHRCILKNTKIQLYVYWIDISLCQSPNRVNICEVSSWNFVSLLMSFILKKKNHFDDLWTYAEVVKHEFSISAASTRKDFWVILSA